MNKLKDFINCETKGDYIKFCEKYCNEIKEIDTAVPDEIISKLTINGIEGFWVSVYYTDEANSIVRYCDVVSLATMILKD